MNIHFSIDDVLATLRWLSQNNPRSIFEMIFFGKLKEWHEKYGLKVTLYTFYGDNLRFTVNNIPQKYINEFNENSDWILWGYHGIISKGDYINDDERFFDEMYKFKKIFTNETSIRRLHCWQASVSIIEKLKDMGVTSLLCPDQKREHIYNLNEDEIERLLQDNVVNKNGMKYLKTNIRFDFIEDIDELNVLNGNNLICFVHEWKFVQQYSIMEKIWERLYKSGNLKFYA